MCTRTEVLYTRNNLEWSTLFAQTCLFENLGSLLYFYSCREKEKKLEEMKSQKNEYNEGFWNVNTVMLGGLGKDPVVEGMIWG